MKKILYGALAISLLSPALSMAAGADYDTLSEMAATVTASDFIPIFDASEADGSRMKKLSFDGTVTNCLTGLGTFAAFIGAEADPTVDTSAEIQAIIGAGVYDASGAAAAVIAAAVTESDTTHCPDGASVFTALAGKMSTSDSSPLTFTSDGLLGSLSGNWVTRYLSTDFFSLVTDTWVLKDASVTAAKMAAVMKSDGPTITIGNGTDVISTGIVQTSYFRVPFKATMTDVILTTVGAVGALGIDVWCDTPGATTGLAAVTDADSLFDTATEPAIADASSDNYIPITSFDSGEDALAEGDVCVINVDSATTLTRAQVFIQMDRVD